MKTFRLNWSLSLSGAASWGVSRSRMRFSGPLKVPGTLGWSWQSFLAVRNIWLGWIVVNSLVFQWVIRLFPKVSYYTTLKPVWWDARGLHRTGGFQNHESRNIPNPAGSNMAPQGFRLTPPPLHTALCSHVAYVALGWSLHHVLWLQQEVYIWLQRMKPCSVWSGTRRGLCLHVRNTQEEKQEHTCLGFFTACLRFLRVQNIYKNV